MDFRWYMKNIKFLFKKIDSILHVKKAMMEFRINVKITSNLTQTYYSCFIVCGKNIKFETTQ